MLKWLKKQFFEFCWTFIGIFNIRYVLCPERIFDLIDCSHKILRTLSIEHDIVVESIKYGVVEYHILLRRSLPAKNLIECFVVSILNEFNFGSAKLLVR